MIETTYPTVPPKPPGCRQEGELFLTVALASNWGGANGIRLSGTTVQPRGRLGPICHHPDRPFSSAIRHFQGCPKPAKLPAKCKSDRAFSSIILRWPEGRLCHSWSQLPLKSAGEHLHFLVISNLSRPAAFLGPRSGYTFGLFVSSNFACMLTCAWPRGGTSDALQCVASEAHL